MKASLQVLVSRKNKKKNRGIKEKGREALGSNLFWGPDFEHTLLLEIINLFYNSKG